MSRASDGVDHRLPTRVNNACQRCRRNKSRCDSYRPCSLCKRANAECISSETSGRDDASDRPRKRARRSTSIVQRSNQSTDRPHQSTERGASPSTSEFAARNQSYGSLDDQGNTNVSPNTSPVAGDAESAIGLTRRIFLLGKGSTLTRSTSAIPDGSLDIETPSGAQSQARQRLPIISVLGCDLPTTTVMKSLLEEYFASVHWFSLVIYEPKFRKQFETIADGFALRSQKTFLILLATVLGIAAWYRSQRLVSKAEDLESDWLMWKTKLLGCTESKVFELMDQTSLAAVQTFILLGSYHVYHGKPNSAFTLLGATIKAAQALRLHREMTQGAFDDVEERKRVWWTIYTWDRFASITYGRPLGINDQDCDVTMPADIYESPDFIDHRSEDVQINKVCYSVYQRELNKLYHTASPSIETVFGLRTRGAADLLSDCASNIPLRHTIARLHEWKQQLPPALDLEFDDDIPATASLDLKVLKLQALALQLTFDSIIIIFYRSLLSQKVDSLTAHSSSQSHRPSNDFRRHHDHTDGDQSTESSAYPLSPGMPSTEQWWNAAVRTSRVTALPRLAQLAADSHLVAFMAINLFNAAIVMVVCALSDPLSDKSQEAKRYITKVYRLLDVLGRQSTLPSQSSIILKDVIRLLLRHEEDAMLATVMVHDDLADTARRDEPSRRSSIWRDDLVSVQDTLNLPLNASIETGALPNTEHYLQNASVARDETTRLNDSLASIQRMFPLYRNDSLELDFAHQPRSTPLLESNHSTIDYVHQPNTADLDTYGPGLYNNAENGLFHIWGSADPFAAWR